MERREHEPENDEDRSKKHFLIGIGVIVGVLGCAGLMIWTPLSFLFTPW